MATQFIRMQKSATELEINNIITRNKSFVDVDN